MMASARHRLARASLVHRTGVVRRMQGLAIEAEGPQVHVGELCAVLPRDAAADGFVPPHLRGGHDLPVQLLAEVVAVHGHLATLMPYGSLQGLSAGQTVLALGERSELRVGPRLLGRVIDGFGRPLDGGPAPELSASRPLRAAPRNPMERPRIQQVLETGVRAIDALLTLGQGQRVGLFSGSGVGKSTLLGMIARHVKADVNVIALIGERGREVREFIEKQLDATALQRSVVVVATADQPALARLRAAHAALAIAEYFRDQGQQVVLTMDSVTRYAMARREVGLSAGEPPTARGYTPSVFADLPLLCERCGTAPSGGSITALLTVLVEGDDLNEPVADALRAILDGHIVLSRHLAHAGQYPAIDVLKSASRVMPELATPPERELAAQATRWLAMLERNHQMVELGAYEAGSNPQLDQALSLREGLVAWLRQSTGGQERSRALQELAQVLQAGTLAPSTGAARPDTARRAGA